MVNGWPNLTVSYPPSLHQFLLPSETVCGVTQNRYSKSTCLYLQAVFSVGHLFSIRGTVRAQKVAFEGCTPENRTLGNRTGPNFVQSHRGPESSGPVINVITPLHPRALGKEYQFHPTKRVAAIHFCRRCFNFCGDQHHAPHFSRESLCASKCK